MTSRTLIIANPQAAGGRVGAQWNTYQRQIEQSLGAGPVQMTQRAGMRRVWLGKRCNLGRRISLLSAVMARSTKSSTACLM
ncbi:MAG: hypothetical protein R3C68_06695 [Myxococcota bacterium]